MNELKFIDDSEIKINYLGINSDEAKELNKDNLNLIRFNCILESLLFRE